MSLPVIKFPVITASLLAAAVVITLAPESLGRSFLLHRDDLIDLRWWRLWSGHLYHFNLSHLWWDGLAVVLLGSWLERAIGLKNFLTIHFLTAPLVALVPLLWQPDLFGYGGMSGMACVYAGGIVVYLASLGARARLVASVFAAAISAKVAYELFSPQATLFVANEGTFVPVASAHAAGMAAGILVTYLLSNLRASARPPRRACPSFRGRVPPVARPWPLRGATTGTGCPSRRA